MQNSIIVDDIWLIIEFLGTFAFAMSGIRQAAKKDFDWFGGFVCGFVVAIGGGTIRDLLIGATPFWMTNPIYIICTILAQIFMIICKRYFKWINNAQFLFDTLGLALFTLAGMEKTLSMGYPFWVAIIMGTITGSAGGVIRDLLVNQVPLIFHKEIYAMASILGGLICWTMMEAGISQTLSALVSFFIIVAIRFLAVRYKLSLPILKSPKEE